MDDGSMIDRFEMAVFPDLPTLDLCHTIGLGNSWTGSSPTYLAKSPARIQGCEVMDISMTSDFTGKTCGSTNFADAFPPRNVLNDLKASLISAASALHVWINSYHLEALQDELRKPWLENPPETRTGWDSPEFKLIGALEHGFFYDFPFSWEWKIIPTDEVHHFFQRARRETTNQLSVPCLQPDIKP